MTNRKLIACAFAAVGLVSIPRQASAIDRLTDQEGAVVRGSKAVNLLFDVCGGRHELGVVDAPGLCDGAESLLSGVGHGRVVRRREAAKIGGEYSPGRQYEPHA